MRTTRALEPDKPAKSVRRLLSELSIDELGLIAIEVIRDHRRCLQDAEDLFETLEGNDASRLTGAELVRLRHDYTMALLKMHGQHQLVSLVVGALGYVPNVDGQSIAAVRPFRSDRAL